MSLQLILGNSGVGKTYFTYQTVIEKAIKNPNENYIIIVPEQFTMQTQKDIVKLHPRGGIMNIDVLSFDRLAFRIFGEIGEPDELLIDDESKNLILRKIARKFDGELKVLGSNMKKLGYISEVKSVISEFSQYGIGQNELDEFISYLPKKSLLSYKLQDIKKIYEGFDDFTQGKFITGEQQLENLANQIDKSDILKNTSIIFDGFTGFTPVQYKLIKELLITCRQVTFNVTIDKKQFNEKYKDKYELFAMSKEMITSLKKIAYDNYIDVDEEIQLDNSSQGRHALNKELRFLEENLFRYKGERYNSEVENIELVCKKNVLEESKWVASTIRKMVREDNYRYRDFAIIVSEPESYTGHIQRACENLNIPIFADNKRSVLMNSFIEYVRSLLEMRENNYTYDATFRFLKAGLGFKVGYVDIEGNEKEGRLGYGNLNANAVDTLENYVLKNGIKGYKSWNKSWLDNKNEEPTSQEIYFENNRKKFMDSIDSFHNTLSKKSKTVCDISTALFEFLDTNNLQKKVEARAQYFADNKEYALEKEYAQIYLAVMELLNKLTTVLQEDGKSMRVSTREFIDLFDAGLEEIRIGVIPPSVDTVIAGDLQRTRVGDVKVLFLVGANDTALPGKSGSTGILSEMEREKFEENGFRLKPSPKEQMYLHKFYMYLNLTKPRDKIFVTYPAFVNNGKPTRPSYIISDLQYLYPKLKVSNISLDINNSEMTQLNGIEYLSLGYKNSEMRKNPYWLELSNWYEQQDEWVETLNLLKSAHLYAGVEDTLDGELAQSLYGHELINSVSRLEKYASCPFKYFVESGLKLREREIRECKSNDLGNVIHSALELYGKSLKEKNLKWNDLDIEEQIQLADKMLEETVSNYNDKIYEKSQRDSYVIERMKRLMRRSVTSLTTQLEGGDFIPSAYELKFGVSKELEDYSTTISLDNDKEMYLRGTIDRVDVYKDGNSDKVKVRVVDYKTGKAKLDLGMMEEGLQLQLLVYLDAAIKINKTVDNDVLAAGMFYYGVDDPIINGADIGKNKLEDKIQSALKLDGLVEENSWRNMERDANINSKLVPISVKKDGSLSDKVVTAKQGELEELCGIAMSKIQEFGNQILDGNIQISPAKMEKIDSCAYCNYKNICGFDNEIGDYKYREIQSISNKEYMTKLRDKKNEQGKEDN